MGASSAAGVDTPPQHAQYPARHRGPKHRKWRTLVVGLVLVALAALLATGAILVAVLHLKFEPVLSGSMRPGIQPGDLAVIRPVPAADLKVGEVIAYLPPQESTPVMHRIVSLNANGIVTKGDANDASDPWGRVKPSGVTVERLVMTIPKVGFLTDIKQTLFIVAGVLALIVAAVALWPDKRHSKTTESGPPNPSISCPGSIDDDRDAINEVTNVTAEITQPKER